MKTKAKAEHLIYQELKWMYKHPEYYIPQWYIRLVVDAEYKLNNCDFDGAFRDIDLARSARLNDLISTYKDDCIFQDMNSSYPKYIYRKVDCK